jgi:DNA processing protein
LVPKAAEKRVQLSDSERRAWLSLSRTENVGPVTFQNLIARFGSASAALDALPGMALRGGSGRGGGKSFVLPDPRDAADELERLAALGGRMIASCEAEYPRGLAAMEVPPPLISVLGHPHLLRKDMVAIVGARNASALARKFCDSLARELGFAGLVVVSGLARGIDASAHEAALAVGTVAVVAGGVDIIYPPENDRLYAAVKNQGVIVSEMRLGEAPQARHFPRRNRIISGLSRGVVVVEAAEKSGSLITAAYALEQGREIFAVPGSPLDPRARGANRLIREGATLTESAEDVLAVLSPMLGGTFREPEGRSPVPPWRDDGEADRIRDKVEEALGPAPVAIDDLIRQLGAPPGAVLTVILELELAGRCVRHPGNRVSWA